ncbi:MAG: hypothetical protein ABIU09_03735 [Pyrinomonadaceae bacterium]
MAHFVVENELSGLPVPYSDSLQRAERRFTSPAVFEQGYAPALAQVRLRK